AGAGGSAGERRAAGAHRPGRSVLRRRAGDRRRAAGYVLAGPEAGAMKRLLLFIVAALFAAVPALADSLVDNVNGYTMREDGRLFRFNGIVIDDEGRVKQLLQRGDRRPERPRYLLDGRGRTLLPGLIDAHGHVMSLGINEVPLCSSDTHQREVVPPL